MSDYRTIQVRISILKRKIEKDIPDMTPQQRKRTILFLKRCLEEYKSTIQIGKEENKWVEE